MYNSIPKQNFLNDQHAYMQDKTGAICLKAMYDE